MKARAEGGAWVTLYHFLLALRFAFARWGARARQGVPVRVRGTRDVRRCLLSCSCAYASPSTCSPYVRRASAVATPSLHACTFVSTRSFYSTRNYRGRSRLPYHQCLSSNTGTSSIPGCLRLRWCARTGFSPAQILIDIRPRSLRSLFRHARPPL
ncbi:hypothetical protein OH77DRAFT_613808 [Trametes cingulata]|nr:hypothetical protein OH77DRAFT_613808 [Trametes cingulata]